MIATMKDMVTVLTYVKWVGLRGRCTYFLGFLLSKFPTKVEFHFFKEPEGKEDEDDGDQCVRYNDNTGVQLIDSVSVTLDEVVNREDKDARKDEGTNCILPVRVMLQQLTSLCALVAKADFAHDVGDVEDK